MASISSSHIPVFIQYILPHIKLPQDDVSKYLSITSVSNLPDSIYVGMYNSYNDSSIFIHLNSDTMERVDAEIQLDINIPTLPSFNTKKLIDNKLYGAQTCTLQFPTLEKTIKLESDQTGYATVKLDYGSMESQPQKENIKIFNKNYIDFSNKELLSSFFTVNDTEIRHFRRFIKKILAEQDTTTFVNQFDVNIVTAVNIFNWMKLNEISLDQELHDRNPNYLQFPVETLALKIGTSNDLSILYATLLRANDVPAIVLPVFNHLIVLLNTGLNMKDDFLIIPNKSIDYSLDNTDLIWLPIDIKYFGHSFYDAWYECRNYDLSQLLSDQQIRQHISKTVIPHSWKFKITNVKNEKLLKNTDIEFMDWQNKIINRLESINDENSLNILAEIYLRINDNAKAISNLEKSLNLNSNYPETFFRFGKAYYNLEDFERAIKYFKNSIKINPNYAEAYFRLACSYKQIEDNEKARYAYYKGQALDYQLSLDFNVCNPDLE